MRKAVGLLFFGMVSSLAASLAVLYKQKSGALDAAQMRITSMERRMSTLTATPASSAEQSGEVDALPCSTRETVALETPARRATAAMVTGSSSTCAIAFAPRSASGRLPRAAPGHARRPVVPTVLARIMALGPERG